MSFSLKLIALNFPHADIFEYKDETQYRNMILWLEDQKIRHYKIEERSGLRDLNNELWHNHFRKYLSDLNCPLPLDYDRASLLDWLLGFAVQCEYFDNVEKYKSQTAEKIVETRSKTVVSGNPLDTLNFEDQDFKNGVEALRVLLQIPQYSNHLAVLKAISKIIQSRLSNQAAMMSKEKVDEKGKNDNLLRLENLVAGVQSENYVFDNAVRILRLLHIRQLRELQTRINETIVAVQAVTANPKTDERLGKVGR